MGSFLYIAWRPFNPFYFGIKSKRGCFFFIFLVHAETLTIANLYLTKSKIDIRTKNSPSLYKIFIKKRGGGVAWSLGTLWDTAQECPMSSLSK